MDSNIWTHQFWSTYKNFIYQLCENPGRRLESLPIAMADRDGWRERERE